MQQSPEILILAQVKWPEWEQQIFQSALDYWLEAERPDDAPAPDDDP